MAKPSKYRAVKTTVDGITFASKAEAARYGELKRLQTFGLITDLVLQPSFELAPGVLIQGAKRRSPPLRYVADFAYTDADTGQRITEDTKGMLTPVYKIKRHLMATIHGINIKEVRRG